MSNPTPLTVVTVYTSGPSCMACTMTKRHLTRRGIKFNEIAIDSDEGIASAAIELGFTTAPVVCVATATGEQSWDGYRPDRIDALAAQLADMCPICGTGNSVEPCGKCREVAS